MHVKTQEEWSLRKDSLSRSIRPPTHCIDRLQRVGPVRLGDVVLDLAPDALAAWLADPAAR